MIAFLRRPDARGIVRRPGASPSAPARRALRGLAVALAAVAVLGACTEDLSTKAACPSLCPNQDVALRDTTISAVVLDTTLPNFPAKGSESFLLVASDGSALDTRAVARFDSLVRTFNRSATDTNVAITSLSRAKVRFAVDTAKSVLTAPVTISVYDVDTPEIDPSDAAVLAAFTAEHLLGTTTIASKGAITGDSISVALDPAKVLAKVTGNQRVRLGVRVTSSAPTRLRLYGTTGAAAGLTPALVYDPTDSTDAIGPLIIGTRSLAPAAASALEFNMRDYTVVAAGGAAPLASDELAVGALPARRVYMRFDIPPSLLDSTTIVRASLLLTQRPSPGVNRSAVTLVPMLGLAGRDITDPSRAALVALGPEISSLGLSTLALNPGDAGARLVELASVVRGWRAPVYDVTPRALVLRVADEGYEPGELRFYSSEAADPALRPRLRITYVPRVTFGQP